MTSPSGRIFHLETNGTLSPLDESAFSLENQLQRLLAEYPDLLPGDQMDPEEPRRFLLIDREVTVTGDATTWFLDHLFVDQDGTPTLVEVKRGSNPELRRKVLGQMLDYAANAQLGWPPGDLRTRFENRCRRGSLDPAATLRAVLGDELEPDSFWHGVDDHLRRRELRLLFVTDRMVPELRRVVEFLNEQMASVEVLALEIRQYLGGGHTTLVPTLFGRTLAAEEKKPGTAGKGEHWTRERFFAELEKNKGAEECAIARELLDWSAEQGAEIWWGRGRQMGSFGPVFLPSGPRIYPFVVWTYGQVELQFQYLAAKPPLDRLEERERFRARLCSSLGIEIPPEKLDKRPSFPLSVINAPVRRADFKSAILELIDRFKGATTT
jgi:hypothetical protein